MIFENKDKSYRPSSYLRRCNLVRYGLKQIQVGHTADTLNTYILVLQRLFNQLPDDTILDWSKLKEIANDILKCI